MSRPRRTPMAMVAAVGLAVSGLAISLTATLPAAAAPASAAQTTPHATADDAATQLSAAEEHRRGRDKRYQPVQLLAFNDFHGNLEPPSGSSGRVVVDHALNAAGAAVDVTVDAGGAAYLATHLKALRAGQKRSFTLAVGDQIGASPLLSAAFHDEPTMQALNLMKVSAGTVGNHEFDEGYKELLRIVRGGCLADGDGADNQNSCPDGKYRGANYPVVAANVFYKGTTKTILPAYAVLKKDGVKIGLVGVVLKDTANIVTQAGVAGIEFGDEVTAINKAAAQLRRKGVNTVVALVHQGGTPVRQQWTPPGSSTPVAVNPTYDYTCTQGGSLDPNSAILPIAKGASSRVDIVLSAHTHQSYVCDVPDPAGQRRLVTSALSFGRLITDLRFSVDSRTRDVVRSSVTATQRIVTRDVTADASIVALIAKHRTLVSSIADTVVGRITADITRAASPGGESALGDLIADAMLADPSVVTNGATPVVAFMNPGGIRADLTYAASGTASTEAPGVVRYEEAFTVQPFNNYLVSLDLTGAQIHAILRQQWTGGNTAPATKILQVSNGFTYGWRDGAGGPEIVPGSVRIGATVVADDASQSFRVVTNNFLADGGDNFTTFASGANRFYGGLDIDGFAAYLTANQPYSPLAPARIIKQ